MVMAFFAPAPLRAVQVARVVAAGYVADGCYLVRLYFEVEGAAVALFVVC